MGKSIQQHDPRTGLVRLKKLGQVVIPQGVRQELGLETDDYLAVSVEAGRIVFTPKKVVLVDRDDPRANEAPQR
jgi:AbrB family looped-hinge helix DNA binding protein